MVTMRQITTINEQNIFDIAVQEYGNVEAVFIILQDNPQLAGQNEFPAGYSIQEGVEFDISYPIKPGTIINIQEGLEIEKISVKRQIDKIIS